jgi:hypothetical protein
VRAKPAVVRWITHCVAARHSTAGWVAVSARQNLWRHPFAVLTTGNNCPALGQQQGRGLAGLVGDESL